jgi:hypothetical protein
VTESPELPPDPLRGPGLPLGLVRRYWITAVLILAALGAGGWWFEHAFNDQGYAPQQYIAYSHKLHAGDLHIPCLYCHFNAERGKHAGVPPMSVCMGCHAQVHTNAPEIKKLTAIVDTGSYTDEDGTVHEGGVVHWARVHRLPDHVYFSHQWHVKAGVACQTCHGPIEQMTVVHQYAPLTMGWCLDCHRRSNYVGGPAYHADDPHTFTVGTANYDVIRARQDENPIVTFAQRDIAGNAPPHAAEAMGAGSDAAPPRDPRQLESNQPVLTTQAAPPATLGEEQFRRLQTLIAEHPDLPRWRVADLPETHRAIYAELYKEDAGLGATFMNAATQCSTCHQ